LIWQSTGLVVLIHINYQLSHVNNLSASTKSSN